MLTKICLSIGYPISSSKSPSLHTVGYKALGIEDQFMYIRAEVKLENLKMAIQGVRGLNIRGVSVTMPLKEEIMKYLDEIDETAKKIGAVNTVLNENGKLVGYNTDWVGAIAALEKKTNLKGKKVAVIGAGGAARAIVYGLTKKRAKVKIFNRSVKKAEKLAKEFNSLFGEMVDIGEIRNYDIIVNATSVGMNEDKSPVYKNFLNEASFLLRNKNQIVFDIVYSPKETRLIKDAKSKGATVVYGYEMLLYQGAGQFKMYTGLDAPIEEMRKVLENR